MSRVPIHLFSLVISLAAFFVNPLAMVLISVVIAISSFAMAYDRYGFSAVPETLPQHRTTGLWLYENGLLPHPNVKGSLFDHRMQHDCYLFVLYNIFAFWLMSPFYDSTAFEIKVTALLNTKIKAAKPWLISALQGSRSSQALFGSSGGPTAH